MNFTLHTQFPEHLAADWDELLRKCPVQAPFLEYSYQQIWWQTRGGGEWPDARLLLITARQEGELVGIAPLFTTPMPDGSNRILNLGSIEVSDYLDLLVAPEYAEEFITGLLDFLKSDVAPAFKTLDVYNLVDSSPTLPLLHTAAARKGWQISVEKLQHSPFIQLPGDWEIYLEGIDKKQRHEIRRKMRRAEEADTPVRWYVVTDGSTLDSEIDAFFRLMKKDSDKEVFLKPAMQDFLRLVMQNAFKEGILQLAFLEVAGQKAAAYLSFDYQNRIWVYNSGLDREFQSYSPGWVLLGYLLHWANEHGRSEFDFMRGDEEYKYRFGAVDRFVVRAELIPPADD
jgi:CelD/BcsL family acetyltransferase involved in cellulose biosynthesis